MHEGRLVGRDVGMSTLWRSSIAQEGWRDVFVDYMGLACGHFRGLEL